MDLSRENWFYPTTLLPLSDFIKNNCLSYTLPLNREVRKYFLLIINGSIKRGSSYIPILKRDKFTDEDTLLMYELVAEKCDTTDKDTFMYLISELTANIVEHSKCSDSLFMAQKYSKKRFTEIAFFDNGITIPGSLKFSNNKEKSDQELVVDAVHGLSSKPDSKRGYGLKSSVDIIVNLLGGEVFIASGKGVFYKHNNDAEQSYTLKETQRLDGTLISFRIPLPAPKKIDIYTEGIL